jgi:two-component system catabolic regulation response regulator CreB
MKKNILVIDNDPVAGEMIVAVLEGEGYAAAVSSNFEDACQKARQKIPALVVIDMGIPDIAGFEACRKIKEMFKPRPPRVIVITGKITMADRMRARTVGADDFVAKTLDMSNLIQSVRKIFTL